VSIDWDDVTVTNNPRLKEVIVAFNGAGGFGAFGSNNNTGDTDPGGLGVDPSNVDDPEKPVVPSPDQEQDGSTGGFESGPVLPTDNDGQQQSVEDAFPECKPPSCQAKDNWVGRNDADY